MELVRQKNVATYIVFPLVDTDGDMVSGQGASADSQYDAWSDGSGPDGFSPCTNEASEIGSTGIYSLSLTQGEMNNDYVVIQIASSGAKTQVILIRTMVGDPANLATNTSGREAAIDASGQVTVGTNNDKTGYGLTAAYDAAKTAAQAGDEMDLVDAPNATAITAIQSGLATAADISGLNDPSAADIAALVLATPANLLATDANGRVEISGTLNTLDDLENISAVEVNAQVVDALESDQLSELSQGAPPATPTIKEALMLLYMALRNETDTTSAQLSIKNDAGTVICKAALSDDGSTFTRGEFVSGP